MKSIKTIAPGGFFYRNEQGERHREDGPAVEFSGHFEWWINGKLHREDGPAIEFTNGIKIWYYNDQRHRKDGPAVEGSDGSKKYYYHGKYIDCATDEEFKKLIALRAFW